jgi:hypothetical protein
VLLLWVRRGAARALKLGARGRAWARALKLGARLEVGCSKLLKNHCFLYEKRKSTFWHKNIIFYNLSMVLAVFNNFTSIAWRKLSVGIKHVEISKDQWHFSNCMFFRS